MSRRARGAGTEGDEEAGRGREAAKPSQIPAKGWKDIILRLKGEIGKDRVGLISGGVAFSALLALFPMLIAAVSLYGLFTSPTALESQIASLSKMMPAEAQTIIVGQLRSIVEGSSSGLTIGAVIGVLVALWSASKGTEAIISSVGVAYQEDETRGFFKRKLLSLGLTLGFIVGALIALALVAVLPAMLDTLGLGPFGRVVAQVVRWVLLVLLFMGGMAVVYRYAPDRAKARWTWVSFGSALATVLWIVASVGLSIFVSRFGNYQQTYGSLAGVIVLLLWLWASAYVILLGAEVNAEIEHQTALDTTTGPDRPMGERGAYVADTIGRAMGKKRSPG
jgi:membrane protein